MTTSIPVLKLAWLSKETPLALSLNFLKAKGALTHEVYFQTGFLAFGLTYDSYGAARKQGGCRY